MAFDERVSIATEHCGEAFSPRRNVPKISLIKEVVAVTYGMTKADLDRETNAVSIRIPRQYAMYLCRRLAKSSYPLIGREFGGRHHTTPLYAFEKVSALVASNAAVAERLQQLERQILGQSPRVARREGIGDLAPPV